MQYPKTLSAFSADEKKVMHRILATKVAMMMGRKFEEEDWAEAYCHVKGIPNTGWSNLDIDIMHDGLGVEHKQLKKKSSKSLREYCGTRMMHPAATRSIRVATTDIDPNIAMQDVLTQYADLIEQRKQQVQQTTKKNRVDMRSGWLLYQDSLEEFLYFEEEMLAPDPDDYYAEWHEKKRRGNRKGSVSLWIFEKQTGHKRYSVTTSAGVKIQPYFDVPPPDDPNLYLFQVQGEPAENNQIRIWITPATHRELVHLLGNLDPDTLSQTILSVKNVDIAGDTELNYALAVPLQLSEAAYQHLRNTFAGVSDEHSIRLLLEHLRRQK